jgi:hypothetical protein
LEITSENMMAVPQGPGIGVEMDEDRLEEATESSQKQQRDTLRRLFYGRKSKWLMGILLRSTTFTRLSVVATLRLCEV